MKSLTSTLFAAAIALCIVGCATEEEKRERKETKEIVARIRESTDIGFLRKSLEFNLKNPSAHPEKRRATLIKEAERRIRELERSANKYPINKIVYVAGAAVVKGHRVATLWTNGIQQYLNREESVDANSIFVADNDVFVAGQEIIRGPQRYDNGSATLWKNGESRHLSDKSDAFGYNHAYSVYVSGGNIYVAGYRISSGAALWKNFDPQPLNNSQGKGCAEAVYVVGEDVYVVGYINAKDINAKEIEIATIWINGNPQNLSENDSSAHSVCVSNDGNVYVAGTEYLGSGTSGDIYLGRLLKREFATLWIDGVPKRLGDGEANSVFVSGNDVYVAGIGRNAEGQFVATLWKNGNPQVLGNGTGGANAVFVSGKDVYVAGWERNTKDNNIATVWENGLKKVLGKGEGKSVFVVTK
jgi:hypothetical protein